MEDLEQLVLQVFNKFYNPSNETSEMEALELLKELPNPADVRDKETEFTLLHHACYNGWYEVATVLIEIYNGDPNCRNVVGSIPLRLACLSGNLDLVKYLILILDEGSDPNDENSEGQTPLHGAALGGHLHVTKFLIEHCKVDSACKDNSGWTPLHDACQGGHLTVAEYLIEEQKCDPTCSDKDGQTPLHLACLMGHLRIAKYLIEKQKCDPTSRMNDGQTPLHSACERGHLIVALYLIEEQHIDTSIKDINGRTPLHLACLEGHLDVTEFLLCKRQSATTYKDSSGSTPFTLALEQNHLDIVTVIISSMYKEGVQYDHTYLHMATIRGDLEIVKFLIEDQQCSPQVKDSAGLTPLHLASKYGHIDIVRYLITAQNCSVVCKANDGSTPSSFAITNNHINIATYILQKEYGVKENNLLIHSACEAGHIVNVRYLAMIFNPQNRDNNDFSPLHIACEKSYLEIVKFLVQDVNCDPMCMTSNAWTPLHSASQGGNMDIIKYLIKEYNCDSSCRTLNGMTPLHLACKYQHFDVVVYLVNECIGDISSLPYYGNSLMEEALKGGDPDILFFLMSHGIQFTSKYYSKIDGRSSLVQPALKVFVLGNAMSGKSTLIKALISNLVKSDWFSKIFNPKVTGVEPHTAGIIPYHAYSPSCGRLIMYDFAGQHEHYSSSHAAVLESLTCAKGDLVFIVVDISRPKEQLVKELKYWDSFVSNQYGQEKPPVIVLGSHFDVAKQQGKQILSQALSELPHLDISITLDCTRKVSSGLTDICKHISTYSKRHHEDFNVSAQVHFLNRLLQDKFEDKIACQLHEILNLIEREDNAALRRNNLLPFTIESLSSQLSKLSEHGEVLYIEDSEDTRHSWIIFRKEVLLSELNGSVFAPKEFESVYKDLNSTGVVALSKVKDVFPHHNHKMLMSFMTVLDFCHEIDKSDISIISSDQCDQQVLDTEQYYFFPSLVCTDNPTENCQTLMAKSYKFGWCLVCKRNVFFTSRFLQVLLLRLAFTFALPAASSTNQQDSLAVERRKCNIWKNGIHWQNMDGVETIVEVIEQNTAVVLLMGCLEGSQVKCIQLRSAVIKVILSAEEKYSTAVDAEESFLHPEELVSYPLREIQSLFTFPLHDLKIAIKERREALTNKIGRRQEMIRIDTLLFFEPYTCFSEEIIAKLIDESNQVKEASDSFLRECAKVAHPKTDLLKMILLLSEHDSEYTTAVKEPTDQYSDDPTHKCFHVFKTWQKFTTNPTYKGLREALDNFSIFRGRDPPRCKFSTCYIACSLLLDTWYIMYS